MPAPCRPRSSRSAAPIVDSGSPTPMTQDRRRRIYFPTRPILLSLAVFVLSCSRPSLQGGPCGETGCAMLREQFSEVSFSSGWLVVAPNVAGASAGVGNGELVLTMPSGNNEEILLRRAFD